VTTELMTPQEIADLMKIERRYITPLFRQIGFPAPAVDLSRKNRRWTRDSIENWLRRQERKNSAG
jgi:hypothetical protein